MPQSKGYNSRANVSNAPGAFYLIYAADFGVAVPAVSTLASQATGSIQVTTADLFVEITWVTNDGESAAGAEATIALNSATAYGVIVTRPALPTGVPSGQAVIGWRIYSAYATGAEELNTATGTIPAATTHTTILVVGSGAAAPAFNGTGIQQPLPAITTNSSALYYAVVPNTGSQWKQQKSVDFMRNDSVNVPATVSSGGSAQHGEGDPSGIVLNHLDYVQPIYPGAAAPVYVSGSEPPQYTPSATYTQFTITAVTYFVMNGYLFVSTTTGQSATSFIGWAAFNTTKGTTTTDGSIVWTCLGKAGLVRFSFANVSGSTQTPAAQSYALFQQ